MHFRSPGEDDINTAEFQCTTVTRPLMSVARIVDKGNRVVFDETGGYVENVNADKKVKIIKDRGTFAIEVEFMITEEAKDTSSGFTRQW